MNGSLQIYVFTLSIIIFIAVIFIAGRTFTISATLSNSMNLQSTFGLGTQEIEMNLKDIIVNKTGQNLATMKIIFAAHNPQVYTVLLNGIHYNVFANNQTISSGDIGGESLVDIMNEQPEFPIISNDTVTFKNAQTIHTNEIKNGISNIITSGRACFTVNGTYFYRQAANLTASGGENEFQLKFPSGCK